MKKILIIIGSPKENSFNKAFAKQAIALLQGHADIEILDFHDLPFMSPDLEDPRPDAVNRVLQKVQKADGLWIFASEYNLGPSAYLKNLLDWCSRPISHHFEDGTYVTGKKVTFTSVAGRSAGKYVLVALNQMCAYMGMDIMKAHQTGVGLEQADFDEDIPHFREEHFLMLKRQVTSFLAFINQ